MKVFLSWSGEQSKALAAALRDYLPMVIQSVEPWFSPEDIDKGTRWLTDLSAQLQSQSVAVVCVTRESASSAWLLFEVGALSKALEASWVCPVLFGIEPSDVTGPLAQFQATRVTHEDVRRLLGTINKRLATPLSDAQIDTVHDLLWPSFAEKLAAIPGSPPKRSADHRKTSDLVVEVLETVRSLDRKVSELSRRTERSLSPSPRTLLEVAGDTRLARLDKLSKLSGAAQRDLATTQSLLAMLPPEEINPRAELAAKVEALKQRITSYHAEIARIEGKHLRSMRAISNDTHADDA